MVNVQCADRHHFGVALHCHSNRKVKQWPIVLYTRVYLPQVGSKMFLYPQNFITYARLFGAANHLLFPEMPNKRSKRPGIQLLIQKIQEIVKSIEYVK